MTPAARNPRRFAENALPCGKLTTGVDRTVALHSSAARTACWRLSWRPPSPLRIITERYTRHPSSSSAERRFVGHPLLTSASTSSSPDSLDINHAERIRQFCSWQPTSAELRGGNSSNVELAGAWRICSGFSTAGGSQHQGVTVGEEYALHDQLLAATTDRRAPPPHREHETSSAARYTSLSEGTAVQEQPLVTGRISECARWAAEIPARVADGNSLAFIASACSIFTLPPIQSRLRLLPMRTPISIRNWKKPS